ncbi:Uncharacterised protein [Vibrio cholerae]|nr:Uncharacterised protein [Vibrio cholerae]
MNDHHAPFALLIWAEISWLPPSLLWRQGG